MLYLAYVPLSSLTIIILMEDGMSVSRMIKVNLFFFFLLSYFLFAKWATEYKDFTDIVLIIFFVSALIILAYTYSKEFSVNIMLMQGGILLFLVLSYSPVFVCEENTTRWLTKEDGFYEWVGALCFLITSIVFIVRFIGDKYGNDFILFKTNRNIFYIIFAIAFFFAFGEEISWGQRIFSISTPEAIKTINFQGEFNIHNLLIPIYDNDGQVVHKINIKHLCHAFFDMFWFTLCILIPVLNKMSLTINRLLKSIKVPISPLWIGSFFIVNNYFPRLLYGFTDSAIHHGIREIAEFNFAILFLVYCILVKGYSNKRNYSS